MGGVIGAVSGKFVLLATGLLVSASIERQPLRARIDPGSEASVVSQRAADRIDKDGRPHPPGSVLQRSRPMLIALSAGTCPVDALPVARAPLESDVDFVIGRDILGSHVFALNFRSRQLRMVLPYEYGNATRRLVRVDLTPAPDGSWNFPASIDGKPVSAALDRSGPDRAATASASGAALLTLASGAATLSVPNAAREALPDARRRIVLNLGAFEGRYIVIDLPHRLLWIDPRARA